MSEDPSIAIIAALVGGDRWLSADACAIYLGLESSNRPNRRKFLEHVACLPSFPQPLVIGARKSWKKSEVDDWAQDQRRRKTTRAA